MIVAAVISASDGGIPPLVQFGGLSLLKRAVLTAQRAGATTCYLNVRDTDLELQQELASDTRVTSRIIWGLPDATAVSESEPNSLWLLWTVDAIFRHPLLLRLAESLAQEQSLVLSEQTGAPLLILASQRQALSICQALAQAQTFTAAVRDTVGEQKTSLLPQGHFLRRLTTEQETVKLEHELLRSLENAKDGFVDTHLNRKLSRPLTRWLLRTPVTPNQVTVFACAASVLGALCFLPGGYWGPVIGALLLQCAGVLDCCDGEIARIKFMESPLGDTLDIVCDTIGAIAIFLGIGAAVWMNGASAHALTLGVVLAVGGAFSFPFVTLAEKTEEAGQQRGGWEDILIHSLLIGLTNRDYSILIILSALAGQLSWFLWGAAIGAHVFWIFFAWLLFRAGRFRFVYRLWSRTAG
jgi:phosphatidylglycerophosphate synthase